MTQTQERCKDCVAQGLTVKRPLADGAPGPRCATHWRAEQKRRRDMAHGLSIRSKYSMTPEQYKIMWLFQNGRCFICQKATGAARKLAVEHEHNMDGCVHPPDRGCPRCWRGLACKRCNRLIAFMDVDTLARAIVFLTDPPARRLFSS